MLDYKLTNATDEFPLDVISFKGQTIAESKEIGHLSAGLNKDIFEKSSEVMAHLKTIIQNEGSKWASDPRWTFPEDLSQRQHLLEGSEIKTLEPAGENVTVVFSKPQK